MKILYLHRTLGDGAEGIHIHEMVKAFRAIGHKVMLIGPIGESNQSVKQKAGIMDRIKKAMPTVLFELCEISYNVYRFFSLYKNVKSFCPDFIYDRYITFNCSSVLIGKYFNISVIQEVNAPLALERSTQPDEKLFFKKVAFWIERWICANATKTIVVSTPLAEYYQGIGVPKSKLVVMPNGVDKARFCPKPKSKNMRKEHVASNGEVIIGFSGILRPWHGIDILIKAVASLIRNRLPVFLLIVGDGPIRREVEEWATEFGIKDHCEITGRVPHHQVPDFVNIFDIAVCPKATFYASPMKLIEYMALGKAVVVPDSKNFLDIVDPGINSISFTENDIDSLCDAMTKLCRDVSFRQKIGANARIKVEERLNWEWNAKEVCKLIKH